MLCVEEQPVMVFRIETFVHGNTLSGMDNTFSGWLGQMRNRERSATEEGKSGMLAVTRSSNQA
jgi:hypothetical protein